MKKDYFDYRSDLNFVKEFDSKLSNLRMFSYSKVQGVSEEEKKKQAKVILEYIENNSARMSRLAYIYAGVHRDVDDWANCFSLSEDASLRGSDCHRYYKEWIRKTRMSLQGYKGEARPQMLYQIIKRIFDIFFNLIEAIVGYDIRQQENYKKWMTLIIIGAMGIYLASEAKELVEWAVELYSKAKG